MKISLKNLPFPANLRIKKDTVSSVSFFCGYSPCVPELSGNCGFCGSCGGSLGSLCSIGNMERFSRGSFFCRCASLLASSSRILRACASFSSLLLRRFSATIASRSSRVTSGSVMARTNCASSMISFLIRYAATKWSLSIFSRRMLSASLYAFVTMRLISLSMRDAVSSE